MVQQKQVQHPKVEVFTQRLDFYWQYIALYTIVLLIYGLMKGTISEGTFSMVVYDPFVILLTCFIVGSGVALLYNFSRKKTLLIGHDFIIFKSRFGEKKYAIKDIKWITVGREKLVKVRRGAYRIIKINLHNKKRIIRIRPSSYWNEAALVDAISKIKKALNK